MSTTATETTKPEFTTHERCDQCGAQAYLEVNVHGTGLVFCKHHGDFNEPALIAAGGTIVRDARPFVR